MKRPARSGFALPGVLLAVGLFACSSAPTPAKRPGTDLHGGAPVNVMSRKPAAWLAMCIVGNIEQAFAGLKPLVAAGSPIVIDVRSAEAGAVFLIEVESYPGGSVATIWSADRQLPRDAIFPMLAGTC